MTSQSPGPSLSLSLSRVITVEPEQVFKAFTDPEWYSAWWGPPGTRSEVRELDLRVGGAYRIDMHLPDGTLAVLYGRYRQVRPPALLSYTWAWEGEGVETLVTLEIEPHPAGTELTVTHEGFTDQPQRDMHEQGWSGSLDRLSAFAFMDER